MARTLAIGGSYEGGLHGWACDAAGGAAELVFSFGAHDGCCRCVATNHKDLLISGGDDELVRVYSLRTFRQIGELSRHTGTVSCVAFCGKKHAASGSEDGVIVLWRISDWNAVHVFGGHKAPVLSIAPHPSGRFLLSTGADRTLRLWDLMNARAAFTTRTKGPASRVFWTHDGMAYGIVLSGRIEVRDVAENDVLAEISVGAAVVDAVFLDRAPFVAVSDGTGAISVYGADDGVLLWRRRRKGGGAGRVKALSCVSRPGAYFDGGDEDGVADAAALEAWAASFSLLAATSTGAVEAWAPGVGPEEDDAAAPASSARGVTARLTCLVAHNLAAPSSGGSGAPETGRPRPDSHKDKMQRKRKSRGASE